MNNLIIVLAWTGGLFLALVVSFIILFLWFIGGEYVKDARYKYRQKHRFDKPPMAMCYCKDCTQRDEDHICLTGNIKGFKVADNWFCWRAEPIKRKWGQL